MFLLSCITLSKLAVSGRDQQQVSHELNHHTQWAKNKATALCLFWVFRISLIIMSFLLHK